MELIFELLFEFFFEYALAFLVEFIGGLFGARSNATLTPTVEDKQSRRVWGWVFRVIAGGILGALSVWIFPVALAKTLDTQVAILIGVPLACGLSMGLIGQFKQRRNKPRAAIHSFTNGFLFALPFVAARFMFAH
jgi:hypothetical protein